MENLNGLADKWDAEGKDEQAGKLRAGLAVVGEVDEALAKDFPLWSETERRQAAITIAGAVI